MSKHWPPDWTGIDGYARDKSSRVGVVPVVLSSVVIGLAVGGALSWAARQADSGPSSAIEWNAVQAVPTRAPDAQDVAWEKRASSSAVIASPEEARQSGLDRVAGARDDEARTISGQQIRVVDGDTFDIGGERIRVAGIDAPETHPSRCANEAALGATATQKLAALLRGRPLWISGNIIDRYGRSVRTVRVNGEDVADAMISAGLARNYDGKKRQGWCG